MVYPLAVVETTSEDARPCDGVNMTVARMARRPLRRSERCAVLVSLTPTVTVPARDTDRAARVTRLPETTIRPAAGTRRRMLIVVAVADVRDNVIRSVVVTGVIRLTGGSPVPSNPAVPGVVEGRTGGDAGRHASPTHSWPPAPPPGSHRRPWRHRCRSSCRGQTAAVPRRSRSTPRCHRGSDPSHERQPDHARMSACRPSRLSQR